MPVEDATRDLFERWERVWHEGESDLISACVAPTYLRHDHLGDRTVTRDAYRAELANVRANRPNIRVVVYDHALSADRAWFRFTFQWTDPETGEPQSQAGMQAYRIEAGKLAETWLALLSLGSAWTDRVAQESWTTPAPRTT